MNQNSKYPYLIGTIVFILAICFLEATDPRYFTQDDNYSQFLPVAIAACRSLFHDGVFFTWNPFQGGGTPVASMGVYALTYPLTYFSWGIATYLLRVEDYTFEVFAWMHLLLGYFSFLFFLRSAFKCSPFVASLSSLWWVFSGFFLIMGRSWFYMLPVAIFFPLLMGLIYQAKNKTYSLKKFFFLFGMIGGIFFHSGNAQMWTYSFIFLGVVFFLESLFLLFSRKFKEFADFFFIVSLGGLSCVAVILPLAIPQFLETLNIKRGFHPSEGFLESYFSFFMPYPFATIHEPFPRLGSDHFKALGLLFYSGTFFTLLGCATILTLFARTLFLRKTQPLLCVFFAAGAFAFLLGLGTSTPIWEWIHQFSFLQKFQEPTKFLPFVNFFILALGAYALDYVLKCNFKYKNWLFAFSLLATLQPLYHHLRFAHSALYSYAADHTYPQFSKEFIHFLTSQGNPSRIYGFGPERSPAKDYALSLKHNFASVYKLPAINIYDYLVRAKPEDQILWGNLFEHPVEAAKAYGIRYILKHHLVDKPELGANLYVQASESNLLAEAPSRVFLTLKKSKPKEVFKDQILTLYDLGEPDPIVSPPASISFKGNGFRISLTHDTPNEIMVNTLYRPFFTIRDQNGRDLNSHPDEWGRLKIEVPLETTSIVARYTPPFIWGIWGWVFIWGFFTLGLGMSFVRKKVRKKFHPSQVLSY